jgi:hypothetical protein
MQKLAAHITRQDLSKKARNLLMTFFVFVNIAAIVIVALFKQKKDFPLGMFCIFLLICGLCCFFMSVNLINALRKVLLGKGPRTR